MPLFNRYIFADYSGAGEDHRAQGAIRLYSAGPKGNPKRVYRDQINRQTGRPTGRCVNFSRDALRKKIRELLDSANGAEERVIFGQDHQYGWPPHLRQLAGLNGHPWREGLRQLEAGANGLPALAIPKAYCQKFNAACQKDVFWSPLHRVARAYKIPIRPFPDYGCDDRFRLTEQARPLKGEARPASADTVGGRGEGSVGGQTICGLRQIAAMLEWDDVAWWPFDGLDIQSGAYANKHVAVEIYPSALRPANVPQTDDNDANHSCSYTRGADRLGHLALLLNLTQLRPQCAQRVMREGWIVGMNPGALPEATGTG